MGPLPPGRGDAAAARRRARRRAHGAAGRGTIRRCPPDSAAQGVHHGGRHARADRAVGIPARSLPPAVPARRHGTAGGHAHNRAAAPVHAGVDAAAGAAHGHTSAAAALCALGVPARLGAVQPVSGNSGRQRRAARGRCDAAAVVQRPQHHGGAVFPPRRAALADAAGHRAVKLHKGSRQKLASAGFLPFSAQKRHAALHFTDRRGILFSLEKHMSAYRGQFSSDLK